MGYLTIGKDGNKSVVEKWRKTGLLHGLIESDNIIITQYFEEALRYTQITNVSHEFNTLMYPMIRKIFSLGKLINTKSIPIIINERRTYVELIKQYGDLESKILTSFKFKKFLKDLIPLMYDGYIKYLNDNQEFYNELANDAEIDVEAEMLSRYCHEFDLSTTIDLNKYIS